MTCSSPPETQGGTLLWTPCNCFWSRCATGAKIWRVRCLRHCLSRPFLHHHHISLRSAQNVARRTSIDQPHHPHSVRSDLLLQLLDLALQPVAFLVLLDRVSGVLARARQPGLVLILLQLRDAGLQLRDLLGDVIQEPPQRLATVVAPKHPKI